MTSGTAGYRCWICKNWYSGEYGEYHLCGGPSGAGGTGIDELPPVPTCPALDQLTRIADALEKLARKHGREHGER